MNTSASGAEAVARRYARQALLLAAVALGCIFAISLPLRPAHLAAVGGIVATVVRLRERLRQIEALDLGEHSWRAGASDFRELARLAAWPVPVLVAIVAGSIALGTLLEAVLQA